MLEQALNWLDKGIVPIRIITNGKYPAFAWSEWQHQLPTEAQVKYWFHGWHGNLGLITGGVSGLVVLDFDSIPVYWKWRLAHPEAGLSYTVTSPRPGRHVYFYCKEQVETSIRVMNGLDIKANGGYVLAPPSRINWVLYKGNAAEIMTIEKLADVIDLPVDTQGYAPNPKATYEKKGSTSASNPASGIRLYRGIATDIKSRLSMFDFASRYTELHASSGDGRWFMGLCPVHDDHSPSFRVDAVGHKCNCYGSRCPLNKREGNDVIDLLMAIQGISKHEAMEVLGLELGLLGSAKHAVTNR